MRLYERYCPAIGSIQTYWDPPTHLKEGGRVQSAQSDAVKAKTMSERQRKFSSILGESRDDLWKSVNEMLGGLSPKLVQEVDTDGDGGPEIRRELEPLVVTRLDGTLPFDSDSATLQCGQNVTGNDGDQNIRLVMEMILTNSQRETLWDMRDASSSLKLVSASYTSSVTFDELKWDRIADANGASSRTHGEIDEPMYEVMLQSKEDSKA